MIPPVLSARARLPAARFILSELRTLAGTYFDGKHPGASAVDVLLCIAVFIGHAEGRPMSVTKLAHYAGIPRASVVRKLRELSKRGLIQQAGRAYIIPNEVVNSEASLRRSAKRNADLLRAAAEVSKMDAVPIAEPSPRTHKIGT